MRDRKSARAVLMLTLVVLLAGAFSTAFYNTDNRVFAGTGAQEPPASAGQGSGNPQTALGGRLYGQRCAVCHDNAEGHVPPRFAIRRRPPEEVIQILSSGVMKEQAAGLKGDEILAIAVYLTGKQPGAAADKLPEPNYCKAIAGGAINLSKPGWNGWGNDVGNSRYQPNPGLSAGDVPRLKVKWAFGYPGTLTYGQPTVIGDRLYVTTEVGIIYCLDAKTGCTYWQTNAGAGVRTAISVGAVPASSGAKFAAYFGDQKSYVHAVDAQTGKQLWKTQIEDHPVARITGAPLLYRDRIYVPVSSYEEGAGTDSKYECCKFRGSIVALNAYTGKIIWKSYAISDPPKPYKKNSAGTQMYGPAGAAIWSAPTLDIKRKAIYAGTGNSYTEVDSKGSNAIVAFDMDTGRLKWVNQVTEKDNFLVGCRQAGSGNCPQPGGPDYDFGSSPILRTLPNGKQVILAGQKSGIVYALDPDQDGKILWQVKVGFGGALGGVEWGPAADAQNIYVAISDIGGPPDKRLPGLTALNIATGAEVWKHPAPPPECGWGTARCTNSQSAAVTVIPGVVFSGSLDGHLRAYAASDGRIIWDFNTAAAPYESISGIKATGGSLDTAGPTVAGGMVYVHSGYGRFGGQPGNVLLAFSVDGK